MYDSLVNRKEYLKRRNRLFSAYKQGCLVKVYSRTEFVTGRRIQVTDHKKYIYAKPSTEEHIYDMYRLIPNGSMGIYMGRHGGGACIMFEEGIYRIEVGMIVKIRTEPN